MRTRLPTWSSCTEHAIAGLAGALVWEAGHDVELGFMIALTSG